MLKFLIDNNLSPKLATGLESAGFNASHVRDYGLQHAPDDKILHLALKEKRVLVSADTDFGFILVKWRLSKPSLILFRKFSPLATDQIRVLKRLSVDCSEEIESGSVIVVEPKRVRIRKLPIF